MSRKMKNLSGKMILDLLAFFVMSGLYVAGKTLAPFNKDKDRMI
ncbi:MAG TPA: hypothetical protein VK859_12690 [bacterium]|jgi:hypothetical protein|nr:hypothetical protein [bacterium]